MKNKKMSSEIEYKNLKAVSPRWLTILYLTNVAQNAKIDIK